jgi:hypothetical protein
MADYSIEVSIPNVGPQGPQGEVGPVGPANELTLGEITTGDAGTEAEATISGAPPNQVLDLVLPRGDTGAQGNPGIQGPGGVGEVPLGLYATQAEAVNDGVAFGGVFRNTNGSVDWIEPADADAAAFIAASGATDRWNIQQFVKGVKALGLWDDMVCWPLRSAQNAGAGTTAYSLGGLGAFNGTLVNGPTWGADGIDFDGSDDRVTLPNGSFGTGNAATSIWAFLKNDTNAVRMVVLSQGNNNTSTDGFVVESPSFAVVDDSANIAFTANVIAAKSTDWKSLFVGNTTDGFSGNNGGSVTSFVLSNAINKSGTDCSIGAFGNPAGIAPFDGKISAVIRINATPTTQLNGDIYTLYKNTLGTGLGLP